MLHHPRWRLRMGMRLVLACQVREKCLPCVGIPPLSKTRRPQDRPWISAYPSPRKQQYHLTWAQQIQDIRFRHSFPIQMPAPRPTRWLVMRQRCSSTLPMHKRPDVLLKIHPGGTQLKRHTWFPHTTSASRMRTSLEGLPIGRKPRCGQGLTERWKESFPRISHAKPSKRTMIMLSMLNATQCPLPATMVTQKSAMRIASVGRTASQKTPT
mmetsp:Transcript_43408/g.82804  ORF Transcript_43408/g.82804 Transcript_43408/m.82804 type:complete len:211 (+) Transcript_43408:114-746(+)